MDDLRRLSDADCSSSSSGRTMPRDLVAVSREPISIRTPTAALGAAHLATQPTAAGHVDLQDWGIARAAADRQTSTAIPRYDVVRSRSARLGFRYPLSYSDSLSRFYCYSFSFPFPVPFPSNFLIKFPFSPASQIPALTIDLPSLILSCNK